MAQLPFICIHCHNPYSSIELHRELRPGQHLDGYCPACMAILDERLFIGLRPMGVRA